MLKYGEPSDSKHQNAIEQLKWVAFFTTLTIASIFATS